MPRRRSIVRAVLLLFVVVNCAIVLTLESHPFVDLPFHLAAATIYRFYDSPTTAFAKYFVVDPLFPEPNVAHLLLVALPVFPSVDLANRVLLAGYLAVTPFVVLRLIDRLSGNPWFALLSLLLLYNFSVAWGFAGFILAIPLTLVYLLALMAFVEGHSLRTAVWLAALTAGLFFTHVLAMLFALGVLIVATVCCAGRSARRTLLALLAAAPGVVVLGWWWLQRDDPSTLTFLVNYYRSEYLPTWWSVRRRILTHDNAHLFAGPTGALVALGFTTAIVAPVVIQLCRTRNALQRHFADRRVQTVLAFGAVALFCSVMLPNRLPGQTALYERFSVFLLVACVLLGSVLAPQPWLRTHTAALCLVAIAYTGLRIDYFRAFAADARPFAPEFLPGGGDRMLHGLIYERRFRGLPVYIHFPDYYILWRHGIATTELTQLRFSVIRRRQDGPPLPFYDTSPNASTPAPSGVDFLLVRGEAPPRTLDAFTIERKGGKWRVYKRE